MTGSPEPSPEGAASRPTFGEAFKFWLKLGFISFGGPTGQIAIMHAELVEKRRWIGEGQLLHALNYCMLLPGPEAQQLATYVGWLLHGTRGAIVAGTLFVLPSVVVLGVLSWLYVTYGALPAVSAILGGLKAVVVAIVAAAGLRIGARALGNPAMWALAGLGFVSLYFLKAPFPLVIATAAVLGLVGTRLRPAWFGRVGGHGSGGSGTATVRDEPPSGSRLARLCAVCLLLWWTPVLLAGLLLGWTSTLFQQGLFFSKAAMVTFGGAYAVLPYVAQQAVERHGWLTAPQMIDGLGLAETTPGPLIMVVQFVGFLGAWNRPDGLPPLAAATLGALMTTWVTFVPCFLWILAGAPYVERLRHSPALTGTLSAITAAVVGVVMNLAVWFGLHVLVPGGRVDGFSVVLAAAAFLAMVLWKWEIIPVVAAGALAGLIRGLVS